MTRAWGRVLVAVARRDLQVLVSYRSTFYSRPAGMVFTLTLFYYVSRLVTVEDFDGPDAYFAFVAVGLVIYGLIRSTLDVPRLVRDELIGGTYERLELSAAGATAGVAAMLIVPFLYALFLAVVTLVSAALLFGLDVQWTTAWLALPIGLLSAIAFAPFALVFCAVTIAYKQSPGQGAVLPVLSLVSGLYFPVALLPAWLEWLSKVQPLTPAVDLMRHVILGSPLVDPAGLELLRLVGFAAVGLPLGVLAVSWARRFSRARGTLLES
jgi:ABC-2 type transport system permease protein